MFGSFVVATPVGFATTNNPIEKKNSVIKKFSERLS